MTFMDWLHDKLDICCKFVLGISLDDFLDLNLPDNPFFNLSLLPNHFWKWILLLLNTTGIIGIMLFVTIQTYYTNRKSTFISTDENAGVCLDNYGSDKCCEVPTTVSGSFVVDVSGNWDTREGFDLSSGVYRIYTSALKYSNDVWEEVFADIESNLKFLSEKGNYRDFGWNLILWAAITFQQTSYSGKDGHLSFLTTTSVDAIFGKTVSFSYFSNGYELCKISPLSEYDVGSHSMIVKADLNISDYYFDYNETKIYTGYTCGEDCSNSCVKTLAAEAMSEAPQKFTTYDQLTLADGYMEFHIDMNTYVLALAVNLGMIGLDSLTKAELDTYRSRLMFETFVHEEYRQNISSYYDPLKLPMDSIYCITFEEYPDSPQCLVRIRDALAYPIITSYGYYNYSSDDFHRCTREAMARDEIAKIYCDLYLLNIAFIYYPSNCNNVTYISRVGVTNVADVEQSNVIRRSKFDPFFANREFHRDRSSKNGMTKSERHKSFFNLVNDKLYRKAGVGVVEFNLEGANVGDQRFENDIGYSPYYYIDGTESVIDNWIDRGCPNNSRIIDFAKTAAREFENDPEDGDLYVPDAAYDGIMYGIWGVLGASWLPRVKKAFDKLCSYNETGAPDGCSIFGMVMFGDDNLFLSDNKFESEQATLSFTSSVYIEDVFNVIRNAPEGTPTSLIQPYYSCVLGSWDSFIVAVGLAASLGPFLVAGSLAIISFFLFYYYKHFKHQKIPSKAQKAVMDLQKQQELETLVFKLAEAVAELQRHVDAKQANRQLWNAENQEGGIVNITREPSMQHSELLDHCNSSYAEETVDHGVINEYINDVHDFDDELGIEMHITHVVG